MSRYPAPATAGVPQPRRRHRWQGHLLAALLGLVLALGIAGRPAQADAGFLAEPPPPQLARLYFYREPKPLLIALNPDVIVNDRSVGAISMGEVFFRDARPGRYRIFLSGDPAHVLELTLNAGETVFVRATLRIGLGSTRISAERIAAEVARAEITSLFASATDQEPLSTQR